MKLYVWNGEGVLENYGSGICIAFASSLGEAKSMVFNEIMLLKADLFTDPSAFFTEDEEELLERFTGFLSDDPKVFDNPIAFAIEGSE